MRVHERVEEDSDRGMKCSSSRCMFVSTNRRDLKRHTDRCSFVMLDQELRTNEIKHQQLLDNVLTRHREEMDNQKQKYEQQLIQQQIEYEKQLARLVGQNESQLIQIDQLSAMAKQAIDKPVTVNNNSVTTTNNLNNISNILCDAQTYEECLNPDRLTSIALEHFEPYFWKGQQGVAEFLVKEVIKTKDGKMLLVCTDHTRQKFRYFTQDRQITDDIGAIQFTQKISAPMKVVCNEVYDKITKDIEIQKLERRPGKIDILDEKVDMAMQKYIDIKMIDNEDENGRYKNTLATLLKV